MSNETSKALKSSLFNQNIDNNKHEKLQKSKELLMKEKISNMLGYGKNNLDLNINKS